ncbi:MAG TPA: ferredoxin [Acidimicrobiales bacterium]|nr:ferredoxin [Acidimicrobiales bacterium]
MKVRVDSEKCMGHQACSIAAPEAFGADDFGDAVVLLPDGEVPPELEQKVLLAQANCPEEAIIVEA